MTRSIYRFVVPIDDHPSTFEGQFASATVTALPSREAFDQVDIWLEVAGDAPESRRTFLIVGTGHEVPDGYRWVATVPGAMGLIWHVLEGVVPE